MTSAIEWTALRRDGAVGTLAGALRCRLPEEGVRLGALSEHLRAACFLCSAPSAGRGGWTPASSVKLSAMVRHRLGPVWPDIGEGEAEFRPGVVETLETLSSIGDMVHLEQGRWLPAAPRAYSMGGGLALVVGGGPRECLPAPVAAAVRVLGRARVVDVSACGELDMDDASEWIGGPSEGLEAWTTDFLAAATSMFAHAPEDMGQLEAYLPPRWVPQDEVPAAESGVRLSRVRGRGFGGPQFSYLVADFAKGRMRRLRSVSSADARRLRYGLDLKAGTTAKAFAVVGEGLVELKLTRLLPEPESRALLLGWRVLNAPKDSLRTHVFPAEVMPLVRLALEGLGIRIVTRQGARGGNR
ncbi:hypothetical protein GALL_174310 [mine drainage metagenome]|uniref:Uncharacterized protein n=1 Tax=mine drainage metagenome TaxID=410659 RepID=A0A1J5SKD4_9ZZZZ